MSLIDRAFSRLDEFRWGQTKRRALFQPTTNRVINYSEPKPERKIPTFGAEPGAFGEDWASYRLPKTRPFGPVPLESHENTHGHISENAQPLIGPTEEYQDPAISPRAARTSEGTDQRPVGAGHDTSPIDKPVTLNHQIRKSFESDVGQGSKTPTEGDKAAADLKHYDFDFST